LYSSRAQTVRYGIFTDDPTTTCHAVMTTPRLAIIVPVLNEAPTLAARLADLQRFTARGVQVVVVDGGSEDATLEIARQFTGTTPTNNHRDLTLQAARGRAAQMNAGAAACRATVLLFLHADTVLPDDADLLVLAACSGRQSWGRFDVRIDSRRPLLRLVGALMNWRSRWTSIATGDQAIFMRRCLFEQLGGFPEQALMEDIAMSRALKRCGPPACLSARVSTSARRWEQHGAWATIWLMWRLRAAYFLGADPAQLALRYGYRPSPRSDA
jgi:rSAM/selenodomain-associated transferase 2